VILFRHTDPRFPFLWESAAQPPARWHSQGDGPVQYLADTPDGAWAEFLRHEAITKEADLRGIERDLWAIELPAASRPDAASTLPLTVLLGGLDTYSECQAEARRLHQQGSIGLVAPSAALLPGTAGGWHVENGSLHPGAARDGEVVVLFGARPDLAGWCASSRGNPDPRVLPKVRHLPAV